MERVIMLADCQSFYASVEKAAHPEYKNCPVVIAAEPSRRSGIVMAACPIAKEYGIASVGRLGEALDKCPNLVVIRPRMQTYIDVSLQITDILEAFTDLVQPFSIDEQFMDVTGSLSYFGSAEQIAKQIQTRVQLTTGVKVRIGIGPNKVLAKMATDIWAKKLPDGLFRLEKSDVPEKLWPQPVSGMFGVGRRMEKHFMRIGLTTIGDVGRMPLAELKQRMRLIFGRNSDIQAELIWQTSNGIDPSPVIPRMRDEQQAIGHQMTLPRSYGAKADIDVILLELSEEVCRRSRSKGRMGRVVAAGASGSRPEEATGFYRQMTLPDPTNITNEVYVAARELFYRHWDGKPVRRIGLTLSGLCPDDEYQGTLFGDRDKIRSLERTMDDIKRRFGVTAILRASSALEASQAKERSAKIGGHYK